jgi:hypothetical protein
VLLGSVSSGDFESVTVSWPWAVLVSGLLKSPEVGTGINWPSLKSPELVVKG